MNALILFPNQIFKKNKIENILKEKLINDVILLEHPIFFGTDPKRKINLNKMKLVLHRASFYFYFDYLYQQLKNVKVAHLKQHEFNNIFQIINGYKNVYYIDVPDYLVDKRMKELRKDVKRIDSTYPSYILSRQQIDTYLTTKTREGYFHKHFYEWIRKELNVLMDENKPQGGKYSYDKYNRSGPPRDIDEIPSLPELNEKDKEYIEKSKKDIESEFPKNYGNVELYIPVTFHGANQWFQDFIDHRLENFGKYEDAVVIDQPFLYHSILSPLINCGLLIPEEVIETVLQYFNLNYNGSNNELLYSVEGFIRQLMGWREWQRLIYIKEYLTLKKGNFYAHDRALTENWYNGTIGIDPIDDTIKTAYNNAYLHHILRLMYMSNFMNLCRIHPHEMYYWFMSFPMDSYDWVMIQNVYSMGAFSDGGLTMTKPYITTGNYITKMSNYPKGKWFNLWGDLYYGFIDTNIDKLEEFPRVSWMMTRNLNKKINSGDIIRIRQVCKKFIEKATTKYKEIS